MTLTERKRLYEHYVKTEQDHRITPADTLEFGPANKAKTEPPVLTGAAKAAVEAKAKKDAEAKAKEEADK